ncbi:uncharacterized protein Z520_12200 [Fonsecaea multimorphosa CBS 102226]|uniref:Aminoglycoside phosphotransferase domain-containing protein n=1 Tax=Fonsecaea multimorphosa CBS 102226 TaxID=1442371 RepID=A0A0D2I478_9EURO|nr:uncharacterized protein Z520_12200 [Fonsecaea multimorphosa CBS 102226]KIX92116.1 hypothetical protein Z520_12200 [Fonsecaea multimorphosa CBS 102226]OAL17479.1 hypothetical protein AYO22_11611 [Fonsecaea multimorphosa]
MSPLALPQCSLSSDLPTFPDYRIDDLDHRVATDQNVVDWCRHWRQHAKNRSGQDRLLGEWTSNLLVKISDEAVVKFGVLVTPSEAANQEFARSLLESRCLSVRVPRVYRFFQSQDIDSHWQDPVGFLIMEFVPGISLSDMALESLPPYVDGISQAIQAMLGTHRNTPGPVDGGEPKGPIWAPDYRAYEHFKSVHDLDAWFDRALVPEGATIELNQYPPSFCHLDFTRRNIIVAHDQTLYLLDWQCSGFFPWVLEVWNFEITLANDTAYKDLLIGTLPSLNEKEKVTHWLLWRAYYNNMLRNLLVVRVHS